MSGLAAAAWFRAARARERALRAEALAEQNELLAGASGLPSTSGSRRGTARRRSAITPPRGSRKRTRGGWTAGRDRAGTAPLHERRRRGVRLQQRGADPGGQDQSQLAVATSDEQSQAAQDVEYMLGEGPARDATAGRCLILASGPTMEARWPGTAPP
ncbi:hypothetical protein NKH77_31745 [Streptomyces sp. M19]